MNLHTVAIEVTALTDRPDLLHELLRNVLAEGLAQYHEWGETDPFQRLSVHVTTPLGERYKLIDYRETETNDPAEQAALPGL